MYVEDVFAAIEIEILASFHSVRAEQTQDSNHQKFDVPRRTLWKLDGALNLLLESEMPCSGHILLQFGGGLAHHFSVSSDLFVDLKACLRLTILLGRKVETCTGAEKLVEVLDCEAPLLCAFEAKLCDLTHGQRPLFPNNDTGLPEGVDG